MRLSAVPFSQAGCVAYVLAAPARKLWDLVQINKRAEVNEKVSGYQRVLSESRAQDIKRYLDAGNVIAPAIVVSFNDDKAYFDDETSEIVLEDVQDAGWVIDGQHRLRGAQMADTDEKPIQVAVVAFIGLDVPSQIQQFVVINKEAKGVPTSLYYDLLKFLPNKKSPGDLAKEKSAAIADQLRKDENSAFFNRIVVVTSPRKGEISLTNFVRKLSPMLVEGRGSMDAYTQTEVEKILDNYFKALKVVFPEQFSYDKQRFFQTLGFGAALNALHTIFAFTVKERNGFTVDDAVATLSRIDKFNFSDWDSIGTGSAAEIQAGKDFEAWFRSRSGEQGDTEKLRL